VFRGEEDGKSVRFHDIHETCAVFFPEDFTAADACIGEEDIEARVCVHGFLDNGLYGGFVRGVEGAGVDGDAGVEGGEFARVQGEVSGGEVAEIDCAGAVACELVGGGAADANGGVCAGYDDDFVFNSPVRYCQPEIPEATQKAGSVLTGSLNLQLPSEYLAYLRS
jgi:hypothetical protein